MRKQRAGWKILGKPGAGSKAAKLLASLLPDLLTRPFFFFFWLRGEADVSEARKLPLYTMLKGRPAP